MVAVEETDVPMFKGGNDDKDFIATDEAEKKVHDKEKKKLMSEGTEEKEKNLRNSCFDQASHVLHF